MDRFTRFWLLLILGMLPGLTEAAEPTTPLQNMQIHAIRATSSLLLYRGEGFQKAHLLRLEDDLRALNAALMQDARTYPGQEQAVLNFYRQNPNAAAQMRAPIYEEKVVDLIVGVADVTDKPITKEELLKEEDEG